MRHYHKNDDGYVCRTVEVWCLGALMRVSYKEVKVPRVAPTCIKGCRLCRLLKIYPQHMKFANFSNQIETEFHGRKSSSLVVKMSNLVFTEVLVLHCQFLVERSAERRFDGG